MFKAHHNARTGWNGAGCRAGFAAVAPLSELSSFPKRPKNVPKRIYVLVLSHFWAHSLQPKYSLLQACSFLLQFLIKENRKEDSCFQLERQVLTCPRALVIERASSSDPFSKCGQKPFEIESGRCSLPFFQDYAFNKVWQISWDQPKLNKTYYSVCQRNQS